MEHLIDGLTASNILSVSSLQFHTLIYFQYYVRILIGDLLSIKHTFHHSVDSEHLVPKLGSWNRFRSCSIDIRYKIVYTILYIVDSVMLEWWLTVCSKAGVAKPIPTSGRAQEGWCCLWEENNDIVLLSNFHVLRLPCESISNHHSNVM